jgi:hypothetical protein
MFRLTKNGVFFTLCGFAQVKEQDAVFAKERYG